MARSGNRTPHNTLRIAAATLTAAVAVTAAGYLSAQAGLQVLHDTVFGDNTTPTCNAPAVTVTWSEPDTQWRRSETFEVDTDNQTVQIDVALGPDGGILQTGQTVYVIGAGDPLPQPDNTTAPFGGQTVGHGINAVNEQITLSAGQWQLAIKGNVGTATIKTPC